jgi:DNA-binding transcriptional regulator YiaG
MSEFFRHRDGTVKSPYHYTLCGLDDIYLVSGYEREDTEYGSGVVIQHMDELHRAIGDSIAKFKKTLDPKEVRFLRHEMDLTQAELGDLLRVTDQTVARWEKGEVPIPGPADLLVRAFYLDHAEQRVDVRKLAEELRANDDPTSSKRLFVPTDDGWAQAA